MRWKEILESKDEPPFKKPKGVRTPEFTKDGRKIVLKKGYMSVEAWIDGAQAGYMEIGCLWRMGEYDRDFYVGRVWVNEPFRGQGVATAMYDFAFRAGFRPLRQSKSLTDGGKGLWNKQIQRKRELGMDKEHHSDYPNRFNWRPIPKA